MSVPNSADAWQTPQIREAMAKLEEAEVSLDRKIVEAKQVGQQVPQTGLSKQDIEQIEEHARSKGAPKELRELQARIDKGDLSWSDIAAGRFLDDPQVQSALAGGVEGMRQAYTMIQEGHDLDEIIDPGGPPVPIDTTPAQDDAQEDQESPTTQAADEAPKAPQRKDEPPPDEDEDYYGGSIMR